MDTREKRTAPKGSARKRPAKGRSVPVKRRKATPARQAAPERRTPPPSRHRRSQRRAETQVVYTPAKAFNRSRFLLALLSVAAVVLALTLGMSIFFKVENVTVSGMEKYTAWDVREASGIQVGDNLMTLGKARVGGKIITRLPYVDTVRIGIKLPDTVNIEIKELDVVYAIECVDHTWWVLNAEGKVLEQVTGIVADNYTKILGVWIKDPVIGMPATAAAAPVEVTEPLPTDPESTEETVAPTAPDTIVMPSEQLSVALTIIACMEENGIIGEATNVDVTNLYDLLLLYDNRYQVMLGDSSKMSYKIRAMVQAVDQMMDYHRGYLDVSFTTWQDKVGYTPFEE